MLLALVCLTMVAKSEKTWNNAVVGYTNVARSEVTKV